MAAIVDRNENTNLRELNEQLKRNLASYARPVFIRLCKEVDMTGESKDTDCSRKMQKSEQKSVRNSWEQGLFLMTPPQGLTGKAHNCV